MPSINTELAFRVISTFVVDLSEIFAEQHRPLKLYQHLIEKTSEEHELAIKKHISAFQTFCESNKESILDRNKLKNPVISYSDRVYIDMSEIFDINDDKGTEDIIWKHLLTILGVIIPDSGAKEILNSIVRKPNTEGGFLGELVSTIEENIDKDKMDNPMEAVGAILQSGVMNDLINNLGNAIKNGDMNLGTLSSETQQFSENGTLNNETDQLSETNEQQEPDFSQIMQGAMSLLGNMDMSQLNNKQ